jgi:hypothetical protein
MTPDQLALLRELHLMLTRMDRNLTRLETRVCRLAIHMGAEHITTPTV